ncbi:MAG: biopolymer transporter ExbD [Acidobacteriota bacterium]|nr:biopolymer transporter ExbD [Acidobacteriota bacterium]
MAFSLQSGNRGRRAGSSLAEINVTPFVDVLLVLLIIFMITAHVMEFGVEVDVPKTQSVKETTKELPIITITKTGSVFLSKEEMNIHRLAQQIRDKYDIKNGVYLRADKETPWDQIAQVMSVLGDARIGVNVVTQPEEKAR